MHILFISDNFPPEVNAPASRTFEHCRRWVEAGHRVTVITCAPNFPAGRVFAGYRNRLVARERVAGIEVIRVWSYISANEGVALRTLDYASYMATATIAAGFVSGIDLVVATSPQFFAACAGRAIAALRRKPFVFELRDLWPESIRAVGALRNERLLRGLERLELSLYRAAAAVVPVTHSFRDNLIGRGIDPAKIHVITNGADLARFAPRPKDEVLAAGLGLTSAFVAGYVGTHGMAHGLETLLEAAARLRAIPEASNVRLVLLGAGAAKKALQVSAAERGLANVVFLDPVPREAIARYWSLLDVAIIHLKRTPLFETVIPSKLFEAMAMGIPVLHGVKGESAAIVKREGVGLAFESEDAVALAAHILALSRDPALRTRLAAAGPPAARGYDRLVLADRMLAVLESLVPAMRTAPA